MTKYSVFIILWVLLQSVTLFSQTEAFNADTVYANIQHLSVVIGPRPMGSANERTALNWVVAQFQSFGADSVWLMPFTTTESVNTNSGIAVGIFRGQTDSTMVIGGHIDSAGREIPGANDNASGTACVIELARVWSQRPRHYTLLFAAFGGEEQGLLGSEHFVNHYPALEQVVLMFALDMAGIDDQIVTLFETDSLRAPRWLVQDAFALDQALGIQRLQYPTHFSAINNLGKGSAGSDHESFLKKGIPALCFTQGINHAPIHTPQDRIEYIDKSMLAQYGKLVDGLMTKYQTEGMPAPVQTWYLLWRPFNKLIFIPKWLVIAFNIVAIILGMAAYAYSRRQRLPIEKSSRIRTSGVKLLLFLVIIAIGAQLGEASLQEIKTLRYPWLLHISEYLWLAALGALAGVWIALQITRKWRFSPDPHVYASRALIILAIFFVPSLFLSVRFALYPGLALACFSLAILAPFSWLKILFSLLAPLPILRLMFSEVFSFVAHLTAVGGIGITDFKKALLFTTVLTLFLILCYLPFIYSFSYLAVKVKRVKAALKNWRRPVWGLILLAALVGYGGWLATLATRDPRWRPLVEVNADFDAAKNKSQLEVVGNEYFQNVTVTTDSLKEHLDGQIHQFKMNQTFTADWIEVSGAETIQQGASDTVNVNWVIRSQQLWYRTSLRLEVDTLKITDVSSDLAFTHTDDQLSFSWFAEPATTLPVRAKFVIPSGAKIIRKVTGIYPMAPIPMTVTSDFADVRYRTEVVYSDTLEMVK